MTEAKGGAMGEENGFVERPVVTRSHTVAGRLRETAKNGKAIVVPTESATTGSVAIQLRSEGLRIRRRKQPDGTYLAWCERGLRERGLRRCGRGRGAGDAL